MNIATLNKIKKLLNITQSIDIRSFKQPLIFHARPCLLFIGCCFMIATKAVTSSIAFFISQDDLKKNDMISMAPKFNTNSYINFPNNIEYLYIITP